MALGSFGEKCKKAIFVHFWLPFLVLALSCNFFFCYFWSKINRQEKKTLILGMLFNLGAFYWHAGPKRSHFASNGGLLGEKLPSDPEHPRSVQSTIKQYFRMSPTVFMHQHVIFKPFLGHFGSFLAHFGLFGVIFWPSWIILGHSLMKFGHMVGSGWDTSRMVCWGHLDIPKLPPGASRVVRNDQKMPQNGHFWP